MKAAVAALSEEKVPLDIKLTQLVRLFKDGAEFRMSKRAGTFVTLRDLINEVGADVTRFVMLTRKNDAPLDFDFDKALEQSKDNPVFYVQYAHARICSVLGKAAEIGLATDDAAMTAADLSLLSHPAELGLTKKIAEWPRMVELAARHNEPHRIAFFLNELASEFHALWTLGNTETQLRFLQEEDKTGTQARLVLIRAVSVVLSAGLGILGVTPMTEMR
jgi:arginyl-tRNA synthetase